MYSEFTTENGKALKFFFVNGDDRSPEGFSVHGNKHEIIIGRFYSGSLSSYKANIDSILSQQLFNDFINLARSVRKQ